MPIEGNAVGWLFLGTVPISVTLGLMVLILSVNIRVQAALISEVYWAVLTGSALSLLVSVAMLTYLAAKIAGPSA